MWSKSAKILCSDVLKVHNWYFISDVVDEDDDVAVAEGCWVAVWWLLFDCGTIVAIVAVCLIVSEEHLRRGPNQIMTSIVEVRYAPAAAPTLLCCHIINLYFTSVHSIHQLIQLFPKSRKLAYDSRQQLSQVQNGLVHPSELFLSLDELSRYCGAMKSLSLFL